MFPCTVTLFLGIRENITGQRLQRDPATANLTTSTQSSPSREKSWQKKIMKIPGPEANLRDKTNATPQKKKQSHSPAGFKNHGANPENNLLIIMVIVIINGLTWLAK